MTERALICEETAECRFAADLRFVALALERVKTWFRARGLRPNLWHEIELAMAEAMNNAIEHGCGEDDSKTVRCRWRWENGVVQVEVIDPSDFLPEVRTADLPEDPFSEGGRGAFLMAQLMDSVSHHRLPEGHALRMTKQAGEPTWRAEDAAEMDSVIESMAADLSRSYEDLSAVFRFSEELGASATLGEFLERAFDRLLSLVEGETAYLRLLSPERDSLDLLRERGVEALFPAELSLATPVTETAVYQTRQAATVECRNLYRPGKQRNLRLSFSH